MIVCLFSFSVFTTLMVKMIEVAIGKTVIHVKQRHPEIKKSLHRYEPPIYDFFQSGVVEMESKSIAAPIKFSDISVNNPVIIMSSHRNISILHINHTLSEGFVNDPSFQILDFPPYMVSLFDSLGNYFVM
jgi:hypothetical protein